MKSFQTVIAISVLVITSLTYAITPSFQGFDKSYVTLGAYKAGKQDINVKIDDAPFNFNFTGKIQADGINSSLEDYLGSMEFTLIYEKVPTKVDGEDRYLSLVNIVVVLEGEAVNLTDPKFTLISPYNQDKNAKKAFANSAAAIAAFNKTPSEGIYKRYESQIDDAALIPWNKERRAQAKLAPVVQPPKPAVVAAVQPAAPAYAQQPKIQTPAKAAAASNGYLNAAKNNLPKDHFIDDESTRSVVGYTLIGAGAIGFIQGYLESNSANVSTSNAQAAENFLVLDPTNTTLAILRDSEYNRASKHNSNRNIAWGVGALTILSGAIILNF